MRFLGRKVYVGFIVVVAAVLAHLGALAASAEAEARRVPARTVARWQGFWSRLPSTSFWCDARSRLAFPVEAAGLPGSLLARFDAPENVAMARLLVFVSPITATARAKIPMVV